MRSLKGRKARAGWERVQRSWHERDRALQRDMSSVKAPGSCWPNMTPNGVGKGFFVGFAMILIWHENQVWS